MNLSSPSDEGDIAAVHENISFSKLAFISLDGNLFDSRAIKGFGLEQNAWIVVVDAREQKSFGLDWASWDGDFQSGCVSEISFWRLRVIQGSVTNGSTRRTESQASDVE